MQSFYFERVENTQIFPCGLRNYLGRSRLSSSLFYDHLVSKFKLTLFSIAEIHWQGKTGQDLQGSGCKRGRHCGFSRVCHAGRLPHYALQRFLHRKIRIQAPPCGQLRELPFGDRKCPLTAFFEKDINTNIWHWIQTCTEIQNEINLFFFSLWKTRVAFCAFFNWENYLFQYWAIAESLEGLW